VVSNGRYVAFQIRLVPACGVVTSGENIKRAVLLDHIAARRPMTVERAHRRSGAGLAQLFVIFLSKLGWLCLGGMCMMRGLLTKILSKFTRFSSTREPIKIVVGDAGIEPMAIRYSTIGVL